MELVNKRSVTTENGSCLKHFFNRLHHSRKDYLFSHLDGAVSRFLDIGFVGEGSSFHSEIISHVSASGGKVYGLDLKIPASFENSNAVEYFQGNVMSMPFEDDLFDVIHLGEVIEHIWDAHSVIKETHRVLKPGGKLILSTPNALSIGSIGNWSFRGRNSTQHEDHKIIFTPASLAALLLEFRFKILSFSTAKGALFRIPLKCLPVPGRNRLGHYLLVCAEKY